MEWRIVDRAMRQLARDKASYDADEARWLVEAARVRVWRHVGLGSLTEYLERLLGYTPRQVVERMRVALALESLPRMHRALAAGELSWSAVRGLSRVANSETEARWIDTARGKTVRQVEEMVAGHEEGDDPDDEAGPIRQTRQLRYEVSGETFAALRQARQVLELEVGHSLEDDEFLRLLAERASADTHVGQADRKPRSQIEVPRRPPHRPARRRRLPRPHEPDSALRRSS